MAFKYFFLAFVAVLAVQSEAKVVSIELFDAQELYALAEQGRINRECIEALIPEIEELGKKVLDELRECGQDIQEIAENMFEKLLTATNESVDRITALLEELEECDNFTCTLEVGKQLVEEMMTISAISRNIIAETVSDIKEKFPELLDCAIKVQNSNTDKVKEIIENLKTCFAQ